MTIVVMVNHCMFVFLNQNFFMIFATWVLYFVYYCIDTNNEALLKLIFKIAGLINDDDAFDTEFLGQMRRRRFSSNFFVDTVDDIKFDKDLFHAIKKQNYIYSISYKDEKKIENFKKFSRIVLIVIHCIRQKIKEA